MTKGKKTQERKELKLFGYAKDVLVNQGFGCTMTVLKYTILSFTQWYCDALWPIRLPIFQLTSFFEELVSLASV